MNDETTVVIDGTPASKVHAAYQNIGKGMRSFFRATPAPAPENPSRQVRRREEIHARKRFGKKPAEAARQRMEVIRRNRYEGIPAELSAGLRGWHVPQKTRRANRDHESAKGRDHDSQG
jgi:hypothetical protein